MKIDHIALWTRDLETSKKFYEKYFNGKSNDKYVNKKKSFSSYFISFEDGARIELMHHPEIEEIAEAVYPKGWAHIAFSVGSKEKVDTLTALMKQDGYTVFSNPRITGDGYYESGVLDADGNKIEITE